MVTHPKEVRLLLVCRDPLLRKLRAEVLRSRGYTVFPATDYEDAKTRCKPGAYEAVLVSGEEGEQEALDFCETVKKLNPEQIVIVIARPHVYIPGDSCPDDVVNDGPSQMLKSVEQALA
jgi:DNA-binding response OmpR family regulator